MSLESAWSDISVRWKSPDLHPWSWVEAILSPFEHEELVSATRAWRDQVVQLISIATEANDASDGISIEGPTTAQLETVRNAIANLPQDVPDNSDTRLLAPLKDSDLRRQVRVYCDLCVQQDAIQRRLLTVVSTVSPTIRHKDIAELAKLVSVIGASERSVGEMQDIKREAEQAHKDWEAIQRACNELKSVLGVASCETHSDLKLALEAVALVGATSRFILAQRQPKLAEEEAAAVLRWAVGHCRELSEKHGDLKKQFDLRRASDHTQLRRSAFVLRESNFLRLLGSTYRQAKRVWRDLTFAPRKLPRKTMAQELEHLSAHLEEVSSLVSHRQLNELLGPHFDGLNTDFETFLRTSEFLISARKLTAGTDHLGSGLRALLLDGQLDDLDQVREVAQSETIRALRRGLEVLSARKAESLRDVALEIGRCTQAAAHLASVIPKINIVPSIKLKCFEQLAEDLAELGSIEAERRTLPAVEEAIRTAGLDPIVDIDAVKMTVDFGDDLAASLPGDQPALTQYLFSEAVKERLPRLKALALSIESKMGAEVAARQQCLSLAGTSAGFFGAEFSRMPLDALMTRLDHALEKTEELTAWGKFIRVKTDVVNERLWEIIEAYGAESRVNLAEAYERVFWRSLARKAFEQHPELKSLSGTTQERARDRFRATDQRLMELNRQELAAKLCCMDPPLGKDTGPMSEWTELSLIRRQCQLQRPRIAIRDLLRRAGRAVQVLQPCWMMSPISVAQFLEPESVEFDIVVIDEASQVRPEEAIGAIARGRQVVVVGDPMQLPPTAFFERIDAFDDEEQLDLDEESILDMALAAFYPFRHLCWHYRSRHESLIAFSNKQFYDNRLIVFPSPSNDGRLGVKYHKVNAVYQGRGGNSQEVRIVAEAAIDFMRSRPDWSLGVATVNLEQAELLRLEIDRLVLRDQEAQKYIQQWDATLEPFFVKNLENVQGDERDCIMISTVYGPNQAGQVMQRFGPINQKTGHRRLNVLFTRAKYRVDLFTSLTSADVHDDEHVSYGVKTLKAYLEYAATGRVESGTVTGRPPDSDFEIFVAEALRSKGYEVVPQVGVAGFYIDIAVKHPSYPHGYLAAIECDGATYHSAKSARDRDAPEPVNRMRHFPVTDYCTRSSLG